MEKNQVINFLGNRSITGKRLTKSELKERMSSEEVRARIRESKFFKTLKEAAEKKRSAESKINILPKAE